MALDLEYKLLHILHFMTYDKRIDILWNGVAEITHLNANALQYIPRSFALFAKHIWMLQNDAIMKNNYELTRVILLTTEGNSIRLQRHPTSMPGEIFQACDPYKYLRIHHIDICQIM